MLTGRISTWEEGDLNGDGYFNVMDFQFFSDSGAQYAYGAELDPFYREEQLNYPQTRKGPKPLPSQGGKAGISSTDQSSSSYWACASFAVINLNLI